MPQTADNALAVALEVAAMQRDRVPFVLMSTSNAIQSSSGWDEGWQHALARYAYMYASGLMGANQNAGNGSDIGYGYTAHIGGGTFTGAPAELAAYATGIFPHYYHHGDLNLFAVNGMQVFDPAAGEPSPLDVNAALTFQYFYGTFPSGTHTFRPVVRYNDSPFETVQADAQVNATTGAYGIARYDLSIPAAARNRPLDARWATPGFESAAGLFALHARILRADRPLGFSWNTLGWLPAYSVRDMVELLRTVPAEAAAHYFGTLRADQGDTKRVGIVLNEGLHSRNEGSASLGPRAVADGDSPEAYADNLQAFVHAFLEFWHDNDWPTDEPFFVFQGEHVVADPDDAELIEYRAAAAEVAARNPRAVAIDPAGLMTYAEAVAGGWYLDDGTGNSHLTPTGYRAAAARYLDALLAPLALTRNPAGYLMADVRQVNGADARPEDAAAITDDNLTYILAQLGRLSTAGIAVTDRTGRNSVRITKGDSYRNADGRAILIAMPDGADWPTDLTGWTPTLTARKTAQNFNTGDATFGPITGTVVTATGDARAVRFDFTAAQTLPLATGVGAKGYHLWVTATSGSQKATLLSGHLSVDDDDAV
jgi:hypothetical protein